MERTVVEYVLKCLKQVGVTDVFGVPGDFAFPLNDAICNDKDMRWIGCCNELNAAYAADGYARIKGAAALCTTYGVGELSALCGVAGSYTEHLPIFHLVGMPNTGIQREHRLVHHTLGNGEFDLFAKMAQPAVCASAVLTPEIVVSEMERLIHAAFYHRRPVYIALPTDHAEAAPCGCDIIRPASVASDPESLADAVAAVAEKLRTAGTGVILAGYLLQRLGLSAKAQAFVAASGLPYATMFMDKTALDESSPGYIGMYDGRIMNPEVRQFVESRDVVLNFGGLWSDFNTGAFTARIEPSRGIDIMHHHVRVGRAVYPNVEMADMLEALSGLCIKKKLAGPAAGGLEQPEGALEDLISPEYLYPRWQQFLRPGDILVTETGTASMGLGFALMPSGSVFLNQTLWGSIGWATPASFGASMAAPNRRVILVTGEGSHQLTVQEISQFQRFGLKPIIFCLNNQGYLIERLLCKDPMSAYNDVAQWNYSQLPAAFGCQDWFTAKVTTNGELDAAIRQAETCGQGAYIEVVTGMMASSPLALAFNHSIQTLYGKKEH
jgi:indolepyruvate decarboxylase